MKTVSLEVTEDEYKVIQVALEFFKNESNPCDGDWESLESIGERAYDEDYADEEDYVDSGPDVEKVIKNLQNKFREKKAAMRGIELNEGETLMT